MRKTGKIGLSVRNGKFWICAECSYMRNAVIRKEWRLVCGLPGFDTRENALKYYKQNKQSIKP